VLEKSKKFDLFVAPLELRNHKILDPEKAIEMYNIGYETTREKLKEIDIHKFL
jgi:hypothetical protein